MDLFIYIMFMILDQYKQFMFMNSSQNTSGNIQITHGCAGYKAIVLLRYIVELELLPSSGNIAEGNFALYGKKGRRL